jgi:hypothetical protein
VDSHSSITKINEQLEVCLAPDNRLVIRGLVQGGSEAVNTGTVSLLIPPEESTLLLAIRKQSEPSFTALCHKLGSLLLGMVALQLGSIKITAVHPTTGVLLLTTLAEGLAGITRQIAGIERVSLIELDAQGDPTRLSHDLVSLLNASRFRSR